MLRSTTCLPRDKEKGPIKGAFFFVLRGVPSGSRTRVAAVKGRYPRPLDDGDVSRLGFEPRTHVAELTLFSASQ